MNIIILIIILFIYLMPALVADSRRHKNTNSIAVLNLFLGWTFIFWVICLAWALSDNTRKDNKE